MKNTFIRTAALAATLSLLTACGADSTSTPDSAPATTTPATTIKVTDMSGGQTDITGVWTSGCYALATGDINFLEEFSGTSTYELTRKQYTTTDGSCGGTATAVGTEVGTFTISTDVTATGWVDSNDLSIAAPTAQNGTSTLPATPTATTLNMTITAATGTQTMPTQNPFNSYRAVDVTDSANITFYELNNSANGLVAVSSKSTKQ